MLGPNVKITSKCSSCFFNYSLPKNGKFLAVLLSPFCERRTKIEGFGNFCGGTLGCLREEVTGGW
jgi:hypothetical protein